MQQSIIIVEEETAHLQQLQSSPPPARQRQQSHPLQQQPSLYLRRRRPSDHATMPESHNHPSSSAVAAPKPAMTHEQLMDYVKGLLDAEQEREATSVGELRMETQTGSTLDLSHCNISALPVEVALYIKDRVERLALSHNPQISLPIEIAQCDRLRYLNLRWNKLRHFPDVVLSLPKLEILDISKNHIDSIPEDINKMTNLKFLAVARNQIKRLPLAIGEMNLVKLKFDENPIEFPPADVWKPSTSTSLVESEKEKDVCQRVKKYMRAQAMREKLRTNSEEDLSSSSNIETPRPPKRVVTGGRFPVRPSISGIENVEGFKSESPPNAPPPIPLRSHARGASSTATNNFPPTKRPGVTPLLTGNDMNRSRSETVAVTGNMRNSRRQGYVPRKNPNMSSLSEMSSQMSARSSHASTLTPPHSRAPSVTSTYLNVSGGESSSGAVSPIDGPVSRAILSRKLSSLPESRNSIVPTQNAIKAVKRVLYMLFYLHRPLSDLAQQLGSGTPRRSTLDRQLGTANAQVDEVDRLINIANTIVEDNMEVDSAMLMSIVRAAILALRLHIYVIHELNRNRQQAVKRVDAFHIRQVIHSTYYTILEARNVCHMLGFKTKAAANPRYTLKGPPLSSRTVTPTQPKPPGPRRRGTTVLPSSSSVTSLRGMAPPVPLHSNGSRSTTLTSSSTAATARWNQSFTDLHNMTSHSNAPSRSNTMRSAASVSESDADDSADRMYYKLKACCDLASSTLPPVRADLHARMAREDQSGHRRVRSMYGHAITKCDIAIATNNRLLTRLKVMRVGDPARYQHEFKQMAENFIKDWAHFAEEIMSLAREGLDIGNIRHHLKPLQSAARDVTRAAQSVSPPSARPPPSGSIQGSFPPGLNTALAQLHQGTPSVPATPLGAALGPAVQATVPPTPTTAFNSPELHGYPPNPSIPAIIPSLNRSATLPPPSYPKR